jgi:hypothetical protein
VLLLAACGGEAVEASSSPTREAPPSPAPVEDPAVAAAHRIVFADRTSQGYLLLLQRPSRPSTPTRDELVTLVESHFADHRDHEEVDLLVDLIRTEPHATDRPMTPAAEDPGSVTPVLDPGSDLLGLHVDVLPLDEALLPTDARRDPILVRDLSADERASLPGRNWAILLRADYRSQYGVRGLRLLQSLALVVAARHGALIHDPDTLETTNFDAFERRRLSSNLGNVADQIAVVPFADPGRADHLRLVTRGMRRFGSVDLQLDGLPRDPTELQRATDFLHGLALVLVREGEFDVSGFAVELPETVEVHWRDVSLAYGRPGAALARCTDCPEHVGVHLVDRPREATDPRGHVVARVVAPRAVSDAPGYDHAAWVHGALERVFGPALP